MNLLALLNKAFLAANLTSPGMINFWNGEIILLNKTLRGHPYIPKSLRLSAGFIEGAFNLSANLGWPPFQPLEFTEVWEWLENVNFSVEQATTKTQNALFALMHSCNEPEIPNLTPTLWIVLALESLYDLPESRIAATLRKRMFKFLGEPTQKLNQISKLVNNLYQVRSRFVHGQIMNLNPTRLPEGNIDSFMKELMESSDFGTLCLVASLQKIIKSRWSGIAFEERLLGHAQS